MEQYLRQHQCDNIICYENTSHNEQTLQQTHLLYQSFVKLSEHWHVPVTILVCNYELMIASMFHLSLDDFVKRVPSLELTIDEWKWALEFYLQMDIDCFFLKTCSFRKSAPRSIDYISHVVNEGLFCIESPEANYSVKPCNRQQCFICQRSNGQLSNQLTDLFSNNQIHTFINQYRVLLNCNVDCSSVNIIYTLRCPCQQYEYIGRSKGVFSERLIEHRLHCLRIIRESLLGESIVRRFHRASMDHDTLVNRKVIFFRKKN